MKEDSKPYYDRLSEIGPIEGEVARVRGSLVVPGSGKPVYKLRLRRGEDIALGHFSPGSALEWDQLDAYAGATVLITGRVYFEHIPDEYGIFARIGAPYLVDVRSIERAP